MQKRGYYLNLETMIEKGRDQLIRETLVSDEFLDFIDENTKPMDELMAYYQCAIMEIETKFRVLNEEFSIYYDKNPIESIKSRVKSTESLMRKLRRKQLPITLESIEENIMDVAGVRVVCSFVEDIYMLADCLLRQDDVILVREKDYIKNPKASGYRSLHLIVKVPIFLHNQKRYMNVEVQLRTIAMDFWASLEHKLRYKKNIPESEVEALSAELESCAAQIAKLDQEMNSIRHRMEMAEEDRKKKESDFPAGNFIKRFMQAQQERKKSLEREITQRLIACDENDDDFV